MQKSELEFIKNLRQASPYIENHRGKTLVVYLPGEMLCVNQDPTVLRQLSKDIILLNTLGLKTLLVLGAEPQLNAAFSKRNINWQTHLNYRVTEKKHLPLFIETLAQVKSQFEAIFTQACAEQRVKLSLVSGNWVTAKPKGVIDGVDFHLTGALRKINTDNLQAILNHHQIAYVTPQAYSPTGEIFNLNTQEQAFAIAKSLNADKLMFFTSAQKLQGLPQHINFNLLKSLVTTVESSQQKTLLKAVLQTDQKVNRIHLMNATEPGALLLELFSRDGLGTLISMDQYHDIRPAQTDDIAGILNLIAPLEKQGVLVKRSREHLELEIKNFYVLTLDKQIIGCAALYPIDSQNAELACLAILPDYQGQSLGEMLLKTLSTSAFKQGFTTLFLLTTQTDHWFIKQGFTLSSIDQLPPKKQTLYNHQRQSKVLIKELTQ